MTESHNLKAIQLKEAFEKAKQDETSLLIQKHEAALAEIEKKIREEVSSDRSRSEQEKKLFDRDFQISLMLTNLAVEKDAVIETQRLEHER